MVIHHVATEHGSTADWYTFRIDGWNVRVMRSGGFFAVTNLWRLTCKPPNYRKVLISMRGGKKRTELSGMAIARARELAQAMHT